MGPKMASNTRGSSSSVHELGVVGTHVVHRLEVSGTAAVHKLDVAGTVVLHGLEASEPSFGQVQTGSCRPNGFAIRSGLESARSGSK